MIDLPAFGLNRFDFRSPHAFAAEVARAQRLGWDWAFVPASSLRLPDPHVNLAFAAQATERIGLGVLLDNPVSRGAGVLASSIATVEALAPGRTQLCLGAGDTAVRLLGQPPARLAELERVLALGLPVDAIVAHPVPTPDPAGPRPDYMERFATQVLPRLRVPHVGSP
jgi:alkanesulfonate monooxygenase SsuD/methylene tetrahydromethanopterin reductase-like flavin-dependent oxidoreductase (luciferase family)